MSAFDEIEVKKDGGDAAGESADGQTPPDAEVSTLTTDTDPTAEPATAAGEGAPVEGEAEATQATEDDQFTLTGRETPEALAQRLGSDGTGKLARRFLPLVKQAGSTQNLRHGAELVAAVHDPSVDGAKFDELMRGVSPSRWEELRAGIVQSALAEPDIPDERFNAIVKSASPFIWRAVEANADVVLRGLLGDTAVTLAEVREAVPDYRQWRERQSQGAEEPADADDLSSLSPALRKKLEGYDRLTAEFPQLKQELTGLKTERASEAEKRREAQVNELGHELYKAVFSVAEQRRSDLGLDVLPTDSPRVAGIKRALASHLSDEKLEAAFDANADNLQLTKLARDKVKRLERDGAFSYVDALKVGAEMTWEEVLKSPEVASLVAALQSELESQSQPKNPTARPEIVAGAAASFTAENPFAKGREEGLSPFDVAQTLAGQRSAQAGR